jgi:hypothetical protein
VATFAAFAVVPTKKQDLDVRAAPPGREIDCGALTQGSLFVRHGEPRVHLGLFSNGPSGAEINFAQDDRSL